eukprot:TRINITY_DN2736_c0_g1_i1.p1 TRINITY_DN2736_c0_g1~~TRINITY_DN2736_c0_g1_i1.p1  ORF type:complete len:289 (+),score=112.86 TRINITY_DN2736_c0_g1_i1:26-868(+)
MSSSSSVRRVARFVDTHVHIDLIFSKLMITLDQFESWAVDNAFKATNIGGTDFVCDKLIHICCDPNTIENADMISGFDNVYCAYGTHPHNAKEYTDELERTLIERVRREKTVAWGEMGLDYHYKHSPIDTQKRVFERQLRAAVEIGKPLVIHTREAEEDTIDILKNIVPSDYKIHLHCFTSSKEMAMNLIEYFPNLYIGITGVVTFGSAKSVVEVVQSVPIERLVLETDGPFMAPNPLRGKTCHSGMIPHTAKKIATIKGITTDEVVARTRENTLRLYGI